MPSITLTDDERDVLVEMCFAHKYATKLKELIRPRDLSGPMGAAQTKALRGLKKKELANWTNGPRANRYQCRMWYLTAVGLLAGHAASRPGGGSGGTLHLTADRKSAIYKHDKYP